MHSEPAVLAVIEDPQALPAGLPRSLECIVAFFGLLLAWPLLAIAGILIRLTGEPVFFRQQRVGRDGRLFTLYKLRTMRSVSDPRLEITAEDDTRITSVGKFLRKTKLDEVPELWNILVGNMSVVGPRPEVPRYVNLDDRAWRSVLRVRPGLTDPVTLRLIDEQGLLTRVKGGERERFYLEALLPWKLSNYAAYLRQRSWKSDCLVIWHTMLAGLHLRREKAPQLSEVIQQAKQPEEILALLQPDSMRERLSKPALPIIRRQFHILADSAWFAGAFVLAYLLRFDFTIPQREASAMLLQVPYVVAWQLSALWLAGAYSLVWRYIGMRDVGRFVTAAMYSLLPFLLFRLWPIRHPTAWHIPASVIFVNVVLGYGGVLAVRVTRRSLYERGGDGEAGAEADIKRVLLVGAGQAGKVVLEDLRRNQREIIPVGFVDDSLEKQQSHIHGVKVLGTCADIPKLVHELSIDQVIITFAQRPRSAFRRILTICESVPVKVRVMPSLSEILQDRVKVTRIRDVQIEDLLGRNPIDLQDATIQRFIHNKVVMVTGAGGSIGSELARQVAHAGPRMLLLLERSEPALFKVHRSLSGVIANERLAPLATDVCNTTRVRQHFAQYRPDIVIHAAAHKHVPLMEQNVVEAVLNNVMGTRDLAEIAGQSGTEVFVLISSDKAVRPTSVMGATKRAAELAIQELQRQYGTRYVAVRFGNVIGSAGSVIEIFNEQIRTGGPVTVTDPAMRRYFMTGTEAAQLVLQAASMGEGGEVFILDMGEPVRILDVAKDVITLSGLRPFDDIDIVFTGVRPGEKLFEEIELSGEHIAKTRHPKIYIGRFAEQKHRLACKTLVPPALAGKEDEVIETLLELVPEADLLIHRRQWIGEPGTRAVAVS
jgi:FlaA1/EpsC-like NDP-sugar epimerase/lipopolysaccharide/colanic/teichoic acid biosynthesis glycosyltransferase